ncbi:protein SRG1 [Ziziphus jujuba]|uniref:Protein SRG1 n=1 Tax=Ziziphus jujuba TaxID=326968 RepID=A0ABM3ITS3_ZIZJJ|nr:protein SRG1 [Ziziphus jujuba]
MELEVVSKTVQELASGEQVPERYIQRDGDGGFLIDAFPIMDIPTIDLGLLLLNSSDAAQQLEKLRSALNTWGCIQVINHGMTPEFLDEVREVTKQFFQLPVREKQKYSREVNDIEGYGNDMVLLEQQKLDWTDRLYLTIYPEDQRKLKFWPENPQYFSGILQEFTLKSKSVSKLVLKALARSLNLEDNCFLEQYGEKAKMDARFNFYPRSSRPDLVLGVKPHADGSAITILLQDKNVEGLQVLKDNQWYRAPIIPEALFINVGDQVEISSNGMFKSPVHRVLTNSERNRISIAVFYLPESDREIEPIEGLVTKSRPRLYKMVKSYVDLFFENYQQGKRPIDSVKLQV